MNRLKDLRKDRKLTQTQLAKIIGVSKRTIVAWENDQRSINPKKGQQLADFFGVGVGYLLGYREIDLTNMELTSKTIKEFEEAVQNIILDKEDIKKYTANNDISTRIQKEFIEGAFSHFYKSLQAFKNYLDVEKDYSQQEMDVLEEARKELLSLTEEMYETTIKIKNNLSKK